MANAVHQQGDGEMALVRSPESLEKIAQAYRYGDKGKKALRSYFLSPYQLEIIDILADETGKGKGDVIRDLIDEWCEERLKERNGH